MKNYSIYKLLMAVLAVLVMSVSCSKKDGGGTTGPTTPVDNPPAAVVLSTTGNTTTSFSLTWSKNGDSDFKSYRLYKAMNAGVNTSSTLIATITTQNDTAFIDTTTSPSRSYFYVVYVVDNANQVTKSNEVSALTASVASLTIGMDPRYISVSTGGKFALNVWIESVADLFGSSFELAYDNTKIVADSAVYGNFLGANVVFYQHYDPGVASIAVTRVAGAGGVSGHGTLATIYFHAVSTSSATISFSTTMALRKEDGSSVTGYGTISKWDSKVTIQ